MNKNQMQTTVIFGMALIIIGVIFLAGQLLNIKFSENLWPLAIVGVGALFFVAMIAGGPAAGGLAVPGSMIVVTGLVLLVQNAFDRFDSWAYAWALVMAACGIGMVIRGYYSTLEEVRRNGWAVTRLGLLLFLLVGAFFELFIYHHTLAAGIMWPAGLILVGLGVIAYRFIKITPSKKA